MFNLVRRWRRQKRLKQAHLPDDKWYTTVDKLPVLAGLQPYERKRLRDLVALFLNEKVFESAGNLELTPEMELFIAAQACLPILYLGLGYYEGWKAIILYPEGFLAQEEYMDEYGLVHSVRRPLIGEAWEQGPVILSWADVVDSQNEPGLNVVIHEMAHKLDLLTGTVNGLPPLHSGMNIQEWSAAFNDAYARLIGDVDRGRPTLIDPYAAESPGEFFAVLSEAFFETPGIVHDAWPKVYAQLCTFYRQDPLAR